VVLCQVRGVPWGLRGVLGPGSARSETSDSAACATHTLHTSATTMQTAASAPRVGASGGSLDKTMWAWGCVCGRAGLGGGNVHRTLMRP